MQLEPGDLVRLKRDPVRAGVLQDAEKNIAGQRMVTVRFSDGQMSWLPYSALEHVPENGESCYDRFVNGKFVSPDWLRRTLTRLRVSGRLSEVVYSMEATETDFYPHQFKPVIKLMESPTDSLLIADEVGLGKTIEAGLIWTELRARHDCNRLLVACPKTLCEKWQLELGSKFGVDVQLANASTLLKTLRRSK
ncbi:MAG: DEAD/DEAH box helicase [Gammaproteobacteria bacterium]|nr:DEAD/DEAH box helicase [Gammaproteobacteria bacterium]